MKFFDGKLGSFKGIIGYLNDNYYSSLSSYVTVSVSDTNQFNPDFSTPSSIIDYKNLNIHWASGSKTPNQYATLYFPENKIYITHYTIQTRKDAVHNMPISWKIEGSRDNKNWTLLHSKDKSYDLYEIAGKKTYAVNLNSVFNFFKVTQTDFNSNGTQTFHLERLELFGSFCSNEEYCTLPSNQATNYYHPTLMNSIFVICFIVCS